MASNISILLILLVLGLIFILFQTNLKGIIGEKTVASVLILLNKSKYKVLNNVVLSINGRTSQIDHIVISDFAIFVIETKNYKGWILGGENSEYWTQVLFKRKEKFYNPIRQNYSHILALKTCLSEFGNAKYISIIVFSSKASIKVNTSTEVTYPYRLLGFIKHHSEISYSRIEKEKIYEKIKLLNFSGIYDKGQHIKSIKQRIRKREESINENKCPKCGSDLILRKGKFGKFLGCSAFPRCKFITNI